MSKKVLRVDIMSQFYRCAIAIFPAARSPFGTTMPILIDYAPETFCAIAQKHHLLSIINIDSSLLIPVYSRSDTCSGIDRQNIPIADFLRQHTENLARFNSSSILITSIIKTYQTGLTILATRYLGQIEC